MDNGHAFADYFDAASSRKPCSRCGMNFETYETQGKPRCGGEQSSDKESTTINQMLRPKPSR